MKGSEGIPALHLETLNKLVQNFKKAPNLYFMNLFSEQPYDSDTIRWEIEYNSAGMTPFVAPGSVAPAIGTDGIGEGSAKAAFYKEKMYFDEEFLNNMRQPGTWATYQTAERKLARGALKLRHRMDRRREWMMSQMFINGSLKYEQKGGTKFTISYGVPDTHIVTLANDRKWGTGASRNPVEDIFDGKKVVADDSGAIIDQALCNSELLKILILDEKIQNLLSKSAFGNGDLFTNPKTVIGSLLGIGNLVLYDEFYEVPAWLTGAVIGGSTTDIPVDDASDAVVGGTLRFYNSIKWNTWEDCTITAVDIESSVITVGTAPVNSYRAGIDRVTTKKKFIDDDTFFMFSTSAEGQKVAEFMMAPYGIPRRHGIYTDKKDEWDPEGMWLRIQDKGLPVFYNPDTTYKLIVK